MLRAPLVILWPPSMLLRASETMAETKDAEQIATGLVKLVAHAKRLASTDRAVPNTPAFQQQVGQPRAPNDPDEPIIKIVEDYIVGALRPEQQKQLAEIVEALAKHCGMLLR